MNSFRCAPRFGRPVFGSLCVFFSFAIVLATQAENWPSWRGPNGDGTSSERLFPTTWSEEENIKWSVELPERGNSSPIVWEDRVFLSQSENEGTWRSLMCFNRDSGKVRWQSGIRYARPETKHETNTYCASSAVTDGVRVYVSYASAGFYCYDFSGRELWHRNFGPQVHQWGDGSSPILYENLCIFYHGPGKGASLIALDKVSGETVWAVKQPAFQAGADREDGFSGNANGMIGSFASPMVVNTGTRSEVVMVYPEWITAYRVDSGSELWRAGGLNPLVYSSPLWHGGKVIAMGGYFGPMLAIRAGGSGDVTESQRVWKSGRTPHRLGTGLVADDSIFVFDRPGMLQCIDPETGESLWQERVRGRGANAAIWGSPVMAAGQIYVVNQSGETVIVKASREFELVAINSLGDKANTTPALSNGEIFIRTDSRLWCIADQSRTAFK